MNIAFSSLKLKPILETKKIKIGEKEIEVKQYLPSAEKNEILEATVQEADMGSVVNTFAIDCFFHLFIVIYYTNIAFTDKQKEDKFGLYDTLETNGIINEVIKNIPVNEYTELKDALDDILNKYAVYRNSFKGALEELQIFVPNQANLIAETMKNIDINKLDNILTLADSTGIKFKKNENEIGQ